MNLIEKMFGTHSSRELKRIMPLVDKIESLRPTMLEMTDEQLQGKTKEFKERLNNGETLDGSRGIQTCTGNGALPCTADRRNYPAPGTYRRDEDR